MTTILIDLKNWAESLFRNLFLSITSPAFYLEVYKNYSGYGIKYLFTVSLIASLISCFAFLQITNDLRDYFVNGRINKRVVNLDHVINQFPNLSYDGVKISIDEETPIFLNNSKNEKVVVIDPDNKLHFKDKEKTPIVLSSNTVTFSLISSNGEVIRSFPLTYASIFGNNSEPINQDYLRSFMTDLSNAAPNIIIYMVFPLFGLLIFANTLMQNLLTIAILFSISFISNYKISFRSCVRIVSFSAGVVALLQMTITLYIPSIASFLWILQFWTNILMVIGFLQTNPKK